jgi:hypothetical protein
MKSPSASIAHHDTLAQDAQLFASSMHRSPTA